MNEDLPGEARVVDLYGPPYDLSDLPWPKIEPMSTTTFVDACKNPPHKWTPRYLDVHLRSFQPKRLT